MSIYIGNTLKKRIPTGCIQKFANKKEGIRWDALFILDRSVRALIRQIVDRHKVLFYRRYLHRRHDCGWQQYFSPYRANTYNNRFCQ